MYLQPVMIARKTLTGIGADGMLGGTMHGAHDSRRGDSPSGLNKSWLLTTCFGMTFRWPNQPYAFVQITNANYEHLQSRSSTLYRPSILGPPPGQILMPHSDKIMLSYFLTTNCNLECVYCYNAKERAAKGVLTLPLEFAKLGTDYFFENFESRHIRFYGPGEPTIASVRMKEIYDYAYSLCGDALSVELQTNGVFNENVSSWIAQHVNIVWVSFDGPPDIQNKSRPCINGRPSSGIIENNVKNIIAQTRIDSMVGARVTITNANVDRQKEMIDYFNDLGIKYIWTDPEFHSVEDRPVIARNATKHLPLDIIQYVDLFVAAAQYAQDKGVFYGSFLGCSFDSETAYHCRACVPVPHLTPDGYVSACDMVVEGGSEKSHMNIFVYGKWNREMNTIDWDEEKIETLRARNVNNMPHCQGCKAKNNCAGYCLGEVLNETGCLFGQKKYACRGIQRLYSQLNSNFGKFRFLHP